MSAVLKAAKVMRVSRAHPGAFARYHRGDPGILDSIWSGIKGAATGFLAGGPAGAIAGGAVGLLTKKKPAFPAPAVNISRAGGAGLVAGTLLPGIGLFGGDPTKPKPPLMPGADGRDDDGGIPGPGEWMDGMGVRHKSAYASNGCPAGYHVNKTGYYTKKGYVAPGSQCVRNRKRNPLNPRAASRALTRLTGTRKAMRSIDRLMNKIGGGTKRASIGNHSRPRGKGCGCRK